MSEETNQLANPVEPVMTTQVITIADLADELGTYRATIFKIANRLDIRPIKRREVSRGNQPIALVTQDEATAIRTEFLGSRRTSD